MEVLAVWVWVCGMGMWVWADGYGWRGYEGWGDLVSGSGKQKGGLMGKEKYLRSGGRARQLINDWLHQAYSRGIEDISYA